MGYNFGRSLLSTTLSNEVWRLENINKRSTECIQNFATRQCVSTIAVVRAKIQMTAMTLTHPLVVKIWVLSVKFLFTFLSLQTSFERVVDTRLPPRL